MRIKSVVLANRQMPLYKPKPTKKLICNGIIHNIDTHIEAKCSGGIDKLKRIVKANTQANNIAKASCNIAVDVCRLKLGRFKLIMLLLINYKFAIVQI